MCEVCNKVSILKLERFNAITEANEAYIQVQNLLTLEANHIQCNLNEQAIDRIIKITFLICLDINCALNASEIKDYVKQILEDHILMEHFSV